MELEKLQKIIGEVLNMPPETIPEKASFIDDLGADSLDIFQIIIGIEDEFGLDIPQEKIDRIKTVADAVDFIRHKLN